jgi:hypothetical protein
MINLFKDFMELYSEEDEFNENCKMIKEDVESFKNNLNNLIKQFKLISKTVNKTIKIGNKCYTNDDDIPEKIKVKIKKLKEYYLILELLNNTLIKTKEVTL